MKKKVYDKVNFLRIIFYITQVTENVTEYYFRKEPTKVSTEMILTNVFRSGKNVTNESEFQEDRHSLPKIKMMKAVDVFKKMHLYTYGAHSVNMPF